MITFYKNQKDLAQGLIQLIDSYWKTTIDEDAFISSIKDIATKNEEKLFAKDKYTSVIRQRLGKKRLELLDKVLNQ